MYLEPLLLTASAILQFVEAGYKIRQTFQQIHDSDDDDESVLVNPQTFEQSVDLLRLHSKLLLSVSELAATVGYLAAEEQRLRDAYTTILNDLKLRLNRLGIEVDKAEGKPARGLREAVKGRWGQDDFQVLRKRLATLQKDTESCVVAHLRYELLLLHFFSLKEYGTEK